jgi:parallel beta-helix repeat protein
MSGSHRTDCPPYTRLLPLLLLLPLAAACSGDSTTSTPLTPPAPSLARMGVPGRTVSPTGADAGDCASAPCQTIGYAVAQADPGDRIDVAAGTYAETVQITKRLTLVGDGAVIDADGQDSPPNGVVVSGADAAGTVLTGFTVKNAGLEGIFVVQTTRVTIQGNTVVDNDAYGPFNPLCADQPDDCGEAIHLQSVTNSIVRGNLVQDNVGGILLTDEDGPTYGNRIVDNMVLDNTLDCGITLASHHFDPTAAASPDVAGVYRNVVQHNTSNGNGAAGIGVFAGPPGAAAWGNTVVGNTAMNNGFGGIMLHSHTPAQNADGNVFTNNVLSGNGADDDNPLDDGPAGISVFSAVVPIAHTVIAGNTISDEKYGIITVNALMLSGLPSNHIDGTVEIPISIH